MKRRPLGRTGVEVSVLCLGSMTWGTQNTEAEGHEQIDVALDAGVNFIDTAEMYPTNPLSADTWGRTEEIIGRWFSRRGRRADVILATKVTGKGNRTVRGGVPISPATIREALDGSLKRLATDYVDLYQLHWPNRGSYHFRQNWSYDPSVQPRAETLEDIHACLETLGDLVREGKIRFVGLSNESCWGTAQFLRIAEQHRLPRVVSIQNEYNLLDRLFDLDLAELSHHEDVGLLAFSPLAAGLLTGKYQGGETPPGSRRNFSADLGGRVTASSSSAVGAYLDVARRHGLDPAQMAIAFCVARPFVTAAIFGATNIRQLKNNLGAADLELDNEVLDDIARVHREWPLPM